ncbi:glycerophosphodiester phosphodiesterase family protein [Seohaeicola zhoushanensis]|uniref:Phosphodiesterase n=1 Tax=Seohaeicola zhoushanensis TaxID=1569283 RepID=A0A8J3GU83_9RHOB|nr:glycerophosphodiester phosphodiesterase family protein [Seohaeicola zhoushanensis]GHF34542.1 phosphodiesterase [Seohaeicola zhoushanensis]
MSTLPEVFRRLPIAHRALHDKADRRPENSRAAIRAAMAAGYGIEIDLQLSADGQAMVFHDYDLERLTGQKGALRQRSAADLGQIALLHGDGEGIPTLAEVLALVAGRAPLLIELKDQDGAMGTNLGGLGAATAAALKGYNGPVALMSFNPNAVAEMATLLPELPRGITTSDYDTADWPLSQDTCDRLREIPDFDRTGSSFISHEARDLGRPRVAELKARGVPILCWTICSPEAEAEARKIADNITFERYLAAIPA